MTSYLRSWLQGVTSVADTKPTSVLPVQTVLEVSPTPSNHDKTEGMEDVNDEPPAFPSLNSAQRISSPELPRVLTDSELMPPPPLPSLASRQPGVLLSVQKSSSLSVPSTTQAPNRTKKRGKVALSPGHSPLDWADKKASGENLRVRVCV